MKTILPNFIYERGIIYLDGWRIIGKDNKGDCDDFALTVALKLSGGWLMLLVNICIFRATFWTVNSPSNGFWPRHTALWFYGRGWIDSTEREFRKSASPHTRVLPVIQPWVLFRIIWGWVYGATVKIFK